VSDPLIPIPPAHAAARARAREFFEPLLAIEPSGRGWLAALLAAAPLARERLGELAGEPGWLAPALTIAGLQGRRACFHHPVAAPPKLLAWQLDHPERLCWPPGKGLLSPHATRLRRALALDEPPGARARAQERARALMGARSAFAREWWRFEETFEPDCLLATDRLLLIFVAAASELPPASEWYPPRNVLHRALEAAARLAEDRRPGVLALSEQPLAGACYDALASSLREGTPHLDAAGRDRLLAGYLGNLTWAQAYDAVR
jgi:hypothetical protein